MWVALAMLSTLVQQPSTGTRNLPTAVVHSIDQNYLYANSDSWKRLRVDLLADTTATVWSIDQQLAMLRDGDLRIVTSNQMTVMEAETAGKERGIGLVDFAVTVEPSTGHAQIVTPLVNSPAFKAGLQPRDVIVSVNGRTTHGMTHEDVMAMLRGDSGKVELAIRRQDRLVRIAVPMEAWNEQAVESNRFIADNQQLGYIAVHLFTPDSGELVRQAVNSLTTHGISKCIIDLRNNPGGYLDAMAVAGSAFTTQILGWKVRRDGTREAIHSELTPSKPMQLVVLINDGTASAAEILAAGLRDTTGARLVGEKTFGRGQIQTYVALNDTEGIVIPTARAESVRAIHFNKRAGLTPDVIISPASEHGENDAIYRAGIQALLIGTTLQ